MFNIYLPSVTIQIQIKSKTLALTASKSIINVVLYEK